MVTVVERTVIGTDVVYKFVGKSTDEKPISTNGSKFLEMDSGKELFFDGDEQGWTEQSTKYLDYIAIETPPTKTTYYEGSNFDATGMTVEAYYTDDMSALVTEFEVVAPSPLKVGDEVKVKYTENGRTRYVKVEVTINSNKIEDETTLADIVENGDIALLANDIEIENQLVVAKKFVLDLNGHALTTTMATQYAIDVDDAELTLKGGNITATKSIAEATSGGKITIENGQYTSTTDVAFAAIGEGSKIVFNDGIINAVEGGIWASEGGIVEVNGGRIIVSDNFVIGTNKVENKGGNTILINDGYFEGHNTKENYEAVGIYVANNDTFTMNNGEIFVENGAGILVRGGAVILNNGSVTATGVANGGGYIDDEVTIMSQSAIIYDEKSDYPGKSVEGISITVNGGTYIGFDKSIDVQSTEVEPQVVVNGGAFVPTYVPTDD